MSAEYVHANPADDAPCPEGWDEAPLSSVADIRFSNVDKKTVSGEYPVRLCNYTDVYNNDYITDEMEFMSATATQTEIDRFGLNVGDVIVTKDSETPNDIGVPAIVDSAGRNLVCGYHLALIRADQTKIDPTFLAKQIGHWRIARYFGQQANGSTRYGLSNGAIAGTPLQYPPLEQQKDISNILRTVDAAISKTQAVIVKLKQIRAGLLHDLLTRGLDHNGELRDPARHPEQFKDSPLGRIPREWVTPNLETLCSHIGSGLTPRGGQDVYVSNGVLFIRSQNVLFEGLKLDDVAFISEQIHQGMLRSEVFEHDVLFNITGASIGRCCAMPEGLGVANVNQHVCILRVPNARAVDATFLAAVLASPIGQRQLDALNTIGNRQGLNYQQLGAFVVPWPGSDERLDIAEHLISIDTCIKAESDEYLKLKKLKSGITSDLLTGRVRVPENIKLEAEAVA